MCPMTAQHILQSMVEQKVQRTGNQNLFSKIQKLPTQDQNTTAIMPSFIISFFTALTKQGVTVLSRVSHYRAGCHSTKQGVTVQSRVSQYKAGCHSTKQGVTVLSRVSRY